MSPVWGKSAPDAWMTHAWNAPDKPYIDADKRVETDVAASTDPVEMLNLYRKRARQRNNDPIAAYSAGYAALLLSNKEKKEYVTAEDLLRLAAVDPLNVHLYASLRFALNLTPKGNRKRLYIVGERLFARNPKDKFVGDHLVDLLCQANKLDDALSVSAKFCKARPQFPAAYARFGQVCDELWLTRRKKQYASMAIAAYTKYLVIAPSPTTKEDAEYQRWVHTIVQHYREQLAK
jgi:predicted Zn-dependent protease